MPLPMGRGNAGQESGLMRKGRQYCGLRIWGCREDEDISGGAISDLLWQRQHLQQQQTARMVGEEWYSCHSVHQSVHWCQGK